MPHATESSTNLIDTASISSSSSSNQASGYGRISSSSYNTSTGANDLSSHPDNMGIGFESYQFSSDEPTYTPTDPVGRNAQQCYPHDYNCCGIDHQNLVELAQHADIVHTGFIVTANGIIPFENNTIYSQERYSMPINSPSVSALLTTSTPNNFSHEQKNNSFNSVPLYSIPISSNKQKGNVNSNVFGQPNGYNQCGLGEIDGFDLDTINQNQDSDHLMLAYQLSSLYGDNPTNPLRDPTTFFGDQTLSSNPSSISTSLDDDNSSFDVLPSKTLQMNDPFSPLLSISSYPATPIDYVAPSPISSDDNVSPIVNDQSSNTNIQDTQRRYGSIDNNNSSISSSSPNNGANSNMNAQQRPQQRLSSSSSKQSSYGSINNNISKACSPHQLPSFDNTKIEQGPIGSNADTNKTFSITQTSSVSSTSNHSHSYGSLSGFLQTSQPRRSSTSTIIPSQSVAITMSQNEQYRSINTSSLGQGNISSSNVRPVAQLRRSSTSNVTTRTTSQAYCPLIPIDKSKLAYMPSVTTAQYTVDGYPLVGHVSSGAKYHPIQPKAGVSMSEVCADLTFDGMKGSKKRTGSTSSVDAKLNKRRVTKPSDDSVTETSVTVLPADLSEVENRSETDIYPYKCVVPGCPKTYKNANGLKYHNEHGHASQSGNGAREKPWACNVGGCLKTYGSKGGLIYHVKRCHPNDLWALP